VAADADAPNAPVSAAGAPRPAALSGEIASREDVLRALDKLCAYYARYEPSSPLPILLQRCKRLVPMNFVDIVRELAPDGLGQIELIAGKTGD
jgi:type VI secretion system protein ImpA